MRMHFNVRGSKQTVMSVNAAQVQQIKAPALSLRVIFNRIFSHPLCKVRWPV
jgi:hypothetical protein